MTGRVRALQICWSALTSLKLSVCGATIDRVTGAVSNYQMREASHAAGLTCRIDITRIRNEETP
jgi:hypothetical protein